MATRAYALNKALHALDVPGAVGLPRVLCVQHPVGTVLGRAKYGNFLFVYQGCTVGGNLSLEYPTVGEGVVLYAGSAVIGRSRIGDNNWIGAGAIVKDQDVPKNSIVFGQSPHLIIKPTRRSVIRELFKVSNSGSRT